MSRIISAAAFVVHEAARRKLGMRHFDVQIIGGAVLPYGSIAEMKTREGKTLISTLAAYFNAPSGESIHVHHCNDKELDRSCARHTETRSHFIRELVTKGSMTLIYCQYK